MSAARESPIALVAPHYAPYVGGAEQHVGLLAAGLLAAGRNVEVLCADSRVRSMELDDVAGVKVRRFPMLGGEGPFVIAPQLGLWLARNAKRYALIHAHSYHQPTAVVAAVAARMARRPFVLTPLYHGRGRRRMLHAVYRPFGAWAVRTADRVICLSEAERERLERDLGALKTIAVIPSAVDPAERSARVDAPGGGRVRVCVAGRLERYKGVDVIVRAMATLPPTYTLTLIGDGPEANALRGLVAELGLGERVAMPGQVSRPELLAAYRASRVFVTLSRYESFGLTVLEAAAAGAVVVASDIAPHRELARYVATGGLVLIDPGSVPDAVARSIVDAASETYRADPALLPGITELAARTMAVYSAVAR